MTVTHAQDRGQVPASPTGKVLGVVDTPEQFKAVVGALEEAGFSEIVEYHGDEGLNLLERVHGFAFGESEEKTMQRNIRELREGHTILSIVTDSNRAAEAAEIAAAHGARFLVHFGFVAVTWLK